VGYFRLKRSAMYVNILKKRFYLRLLLSAQICSLIVPTVISYIQAGTNNANSLIWDDIDKLDIKGMKEEKRFNGLSNKRLILFRDIHCHEEAQCHIACSISEISRKLNVDKIFLEGADGRVDTLLFETFPSEKIRCNIGKNFLHEGYLSGAEYAAIQMGPNNRTTLYGIEDASVYVKNYDSFNETRRLFVQCGNSINQVNLFLKKVKKTSFSNRLQSIDDLYQILQGRYDGNLLDKVRAIDMAFSGSAGNPFSGCVEFKKLHALIQLDAQLNENTVDSELSESLSEMEIMVPAKDFRDLKQKFCQYQFNRIPATGYLDYLEKLYEAYSQNGRSFYDVFPNLKTLSAFNRMKEEIFSPSFTEKLKNLVETKLKNYAKKEGAEEIRKIDYTWMMLEKLMTLKLTREELQIVKQFDMDKELRGIFDKINDIAGNNNIKDVPKREAVLYDITRSAGMFYKYAGERDVIMANRSLKSISDNETAILVVGGFHYEGIRKILEEKNISYITYSPEIKTSADMKIYERRMFETRYDLSKNMFTEKRYAWRMRSNETLRMLAAPILLGDILKSIESNRNQIFSQKVAMLEEMVKNAPGDNKGWNNVNMLLDDWFKNPVNEKKLKNLSINDLNILFESVREGVFLDLPKLRNKIENSGSVYPGEIAEVVIATIKTSGIGTGLVRLTELYFEKLLNEPGESKLLYRGQNTLDLFGLDYARFKIYADAIAKFETAVRKDADLFQISRYLISMRTQWRFAKNVHDMTKKFKKMKMKNAFPMALIYAFYNNYADITDSEDSLKQLTNLFEENLKDFLNGLNPARVEKSMLCRWYNLPENFEFTQIEKKTARALMGNDPVLFGEGIGADRKLMDAISKFALTGKQNVTYVHPFSDESQIIGRKIPREGTDRLEPGYGELLRVVESADENPGTKHIWIIKNIEAMQPGIRSVLQEVLRIREVNIPGFGKRKLPDNVQILITMDQVAELEDDSFLDRVFVKNVSTDHIADEHILKDLKPGNLDNIKIKSGYLVLPEKTRGEIKIKLSDEFKSLTNANLHNELYKRIGLILDEDTVRMLMAMEIISGSGSTILQIEGSSGVGKTFTAGKYALLTGREFRSHPASRGTDISEFIGGYEQDDENKFYFNRATKIRQILENGGVIALSELNALVDDNDKVSISWWLQQLAEAKPDENGYKTVWITEIPTAAGKYRRNDLDKIRVHPKAVVVIDTNPSDKYQARGDFPRIFNEYTEKITISDFIGKEDGINAVQIKQSNLNNIKQHLRMFLKYDWVIENKVIAESISNTTARNNITGKASELFDIIVQAYINGKIGRQENIVFTKRELKRFAEDILYAKNTLKIKNNNQAIAYAANLNLVVRWNNKEDREKARKIVREFLGKDIFIRDLNLSEFIEDQMFKKHRFAHVNVSIDTYLTDEVDAISQKYPDLKIKTVSATDETNRFMLEGGYIQGESGKIELAKGVFAGIEDELAKLKEDEQILYIIENAHNIPADEIIALNETLQDRMVKVRGKDAASIPLRAHILFVSRRDSELNWSPAEKSRAVSMGYDPNSSLYTYDFISRMKSQAPQWKPIISNIGISLEKLDEQYNEFLADQATLVSKQSKKRFKAFLEKIVSIAAKYELEEYNAFFEKIMDEIDYFYFRSLAPEYFNEKLTSIKKQAQDSFNLMVTPVRIEMLNKRQTASAQSQTLFDELNTHISRITGSQTDEDRQKLFLEIKDLLISGRPGVSKLKQQELPSNQLYFPDMFSVKSLRKTIADWKTFGVMCSVLGDGSIIVVEKSGKTVNRYYKEGNEWKLNLPRHSLMLSEPEARITCMTELNDGSVIVAYDRGYTRRYFVEGNELKYNEFPLFIELFLKTIYSITALNDGSFVTGGFSGDLRRYYLDGYEWKYTELPRWVETPDSMTGLADGSFIVYNEHYGEIGRYYFEDNVWKYKDLPLLRNMKKNICAVTALGDGSFVIGMNDGKVIRYYLEDNEWKYNELPEFGGWITKMAALSDGSIVAGGVNPGKIGRYYLEDNEWKFKEIMYLGEAIVSMSALGDNSIIVVGGSGKIFLCDLTEHMVIMIDEEKFMTDNGKLIGKDDLPDQVTLFTPVAEQTAGDWYTGASMLLSEILGAQTDEAKQTLVLKLKDFLRTNRPDISKLEQQELQSDQLWFGKIFSFQSTLTDLKIFEEGIISTAVSGDGSIIVGGGNGIIRKVYLEGNEWKYVELPPFGNPIRDLAVLGDGSIIAGEYYGKLKRYYMENNEWKIADLPPLGDIIESMNDLGDGSIIIGGIDGKIIKYYIEDNEIKCDDVFADFDDSVNLTVKLGDGSIVVGGYYGGIKRYYKEGNECKSSGLPDFRKTIYAIVGLNDGSIVVGGADGKIGRYYLEGNVWKYADLPNFGNLAKSMVVLSDGSILVGGAEGKIGRYYLEGNVWKYTDLPNFGNLTKPMVVINDGSIVVVRDGGRIGRYYMEDNMWKYTDFQNFGQLIFSISLLGNGNIIVGGNKGKLGLYDLTGGMGIMIDDKQLVTDSGQFVSKENLPGTVMILYAKIEEKTEVKEETFSAEYEGLPFYYALGEDGLVYLNYQGTWYRTNHKTTGNYASYPVKSKSVSFFDGVAGTDSTRSVKVLDLKDIIYPWTGKNLNRDDFLLETDVVKGVESTTLRALNEGWAVSLEGDPGGGKTSIGKEIALLLGLPKYVFQMHGRRNLSDWIGGYSEDGYGNVQRDNNPDENGRFKQQFLNALVNGGVFIVDEGAVGEKARAMLNWLSQILRRRTRGGELVLNEFPGLEIPLRIHPDFHLIITTNLPEHTQAREIIKSEVGSNIFTVYVDEDEGPETLKKLFLHFLRDVDIDADTKDKIADQVKKFHRELKSRIGTDLGMDDKDRHYISKRELRRLANIIRWANSGIGKGDPYFSFYVGLRVAYESMFTHKWEKDEVRYICEKYLEKLEPDVVSRLVEKYEKTKRESFSDKIKKMILTDSELEAAFIVKMSFAANEPVIMTNEPHNRGSDVVWNVVNELKTELVIIDADPDQTDAEILGGPFPDVSKGETKKVKQVLGKITAVLDKASKDGKPVTLWIRNIDLWNEDLRTALNGFLEDGVLRVGDRKYYSLPHVNIIADMGTAAVEDFSSAFYNRWVKVGFPSEQPPAKGLYRREEILRLLGENKQEKLIDLFENQILMPVDKKGRWYLFNPKSDLSAVSEEVKRDKLYRHIADYVKESAKLSEFETALVKRFGLNMMEASYLSKLFISIKEIDSGGARSRWYENMSYNISTSLFYMVAHCVQLYKNFNTELLNMEMELRRRFGDKYNDYMVGGVPEGIEAQTLNLYNQYHDLILQRIAQETLAVIGVRFKGRDLDILSELIRKTLSLNTTPKLDTNIYTTTGNLQGIVKFVGDVPLFARDGAVAPVDVAENNAVWYNESTKKGLSILARASILGTTVAFIGEPGSVKTTLTAHYAQITGRAYYKYQVHKKSRRDDLTVTIEQKEDGNFKKRVMDLYMYLQGKIPDPSNPGKWIDSGKGVVIDIDEANIQPEILWVLEPVIRGEQWVHPIFPEMEPFRIGPRVQLVLSYNPDYFNGREQIDRRLTDNMIVAWMDLPNEKEQPEIIETFYGVWAKEGTAVDIKQKQPKKKTIPFVPPSEVTAKITNINYDHKKIGDSIKAFHETKDISSKVDIFLNALTHYMNALANRDGSLYNRDMLDITQELDSILKGKGKEGKIREMMAFIQKEYAQVYPDKTRLRYAILELRSFFNYFDRHLVVYMSSPYNREVPFLHIYPNRILKRISLANKRSWENSGEALVIEGHGLEKGGKLGYFDGEFALVDASKTDGPESEQTEWTAHHELAHVNDSTPGRFVPKNIELNAMLSPLIHSRAKSDYLRNELFMWLYCDKASYYTQAAKGILNGLVLRYSELYGGEKYEITDDFLEQDIQAVDKILAGFSQETIEELALYLYDHPQYMESGNKGKYKQKAVGRTGDAQSGIEEVSQGVDGQIEFEIETVEGSTAEIGIDQPMGNDEISDQTAEELPRDIQKRRDDDLEKQASLTAGIQDEIDKSIADAEDYYGKMILEGSSQSQVIFDRLLRSLRTGWKNVVLKMRSGLEVDPLAVMLKLKDKFTRRLRIYTMSTQATVVLFDASGSLEGLKKQIGYAIRSIGDNFWNLKNIAPKHFYYNMTLYTEKRPKTFVEMSRLYSEDEWKRQCAAMGKMIGEGGNDMLKALKDQFENFVGSEMPSEVRRAKKKTLILFTDGKDDAIVMGSKGYQPSADLNMLLKKYRDAGVEIFAIGFGDGAKPVTAFYGQRQHYITIREDRPYDVPEAIAKIMEARARGLGVVPDGNVTKFFNIGKEGVSQMKPLVKNSFSLTPEGYIAADNGITNMEVNQSIETFMNATESIKNIIKIDAVTVDMRNTKDTEVNGLMAEFLRYNNDLKNKLDGVRITVLGNKISLAENEKGSSYAHYGEKQGPAIFIGEGLLKYLLKNDPESLLVLFEIELNRKKYREKFGSDTRSSAQVLKDANIASAQENHLIESIMSAELINSVKGMNNEEMIIKTAEFLKNKRSDIKLLEIFGVIIQKHPDLFDTVVYQLATRIKSSAKFGELVKREDIKEFLEKLKNNEIDYDSIDINGLADFFGVDIIDMIRIINEFMPHGALKMSEKMKFRKESLFDSMV